MSYLSAKRSRLAAIVQPKSGSEKNRAGRGNARRSMTRSQTRPAQMPYTAGIAAACPLRFAAASRLPRWVTAWTLRACHPLRLTPAVAALLCLPACSSSPLALEAPNVAPNKSRAPTSVDLDPIGDKGGAVVGDYASPGPAAVLTAAMKAELDGRALRGGEPGGYRVACVLGRFAARSHGSVTESQEMLVLYADLTCEAKRTSDGAVVWRGELRGRAAESGANVLGSESSVTQRLAVRALSDASREMASDLVLRGLALQAEPSARVFTDDQAQRGEGGLDDTPWGPAALEENAAAVDGAMKEATADDPVTRAAAWNVVAMSVGPGDAWTAGDKMHLDDDPLVRFQQYKALARLGTPGSLDQLRAMAEKEDDVLLGEFVRDAIASGGIGLVRSRR